MAEAARTYWLTSPCRIRREDQSLVVEREDGRRLHIPITDVRDIVATAPVDVNTAVVSLLGRNRIDIHLLSHYGDYAGTLAAADHSVSGATVLAQTRLVSDDERRLAVARALVVATAFNVRRVVDRTHLDRPYTTLVETVESADASDTLMGLEGNFRRTAWGVLDTKLPEWLRLGGRSRRPPANAGNAFVSYVNGIIYSRALTALRLTPLHTGIGFLHSSLERQRHTLALDLAEVFKPLFAERLLLRLAGRRQLEPRHFDQQVNHAMLTDEGRKFVVTTVRDELNETITHRKLGRKVAYGELMYLEALKLTRTCLEGEPYQPFRIWW